MKSLDTGKNYIERLGNLGYLYKGHLGKSRRYYFYKLDNNKEKYHLHLVEYEDINWFNLVSFRDLLRKNVQLALKYNDLKVNLQKKYSKDRQSYTEMKQEFILDVLAEGIGK